MRCAQRGAYDHKKRNADYIGNHYRCADFAGDRAELCSEDITGSAALI